ncbi:hypothetical protein D3C80_1876830 [compost metagenome]
MYDFAAVLGIFGAKCFGIGGTPLEAAAGGAVVVGGCCSNSTNSFESNGLEPKLSSLGNASLKSSLLFVVMSGRAFAVGDAESN